MTQLHILNGDATLTGFNETGLDGDVLVWREVFSEGPLAETLDAEFWETRQGFIERTFKSGSADYHEMVMLELEKLNEPYDEITLWFEYDLHCQVNMLGALQLLKDHVDLSEPGLYLVCPDHYPGVENFRGMGQLSGDQLEDLYDTRLHLTDYDLSLATEAWQKYIAADASVLKDWIEATPFWGSLHMLKPALEAHVKRLQLNGELHGFIEQKLLQFYKAGLNDRASLYEAFWNENAIYGMSDAELDIYMDRLHENGFIQLQGRKA
jgi:hypothetical protein